MRTSYRMTAGLLSVLALAGCATPPMGPMVEVIPGPNKGFDAFQEDQGVCRGFAYSQVAGQAEAANQRAVGGTVLSTVIGAGLGAALGGGRGAVVGAATGAGIGAGLNSGATAGAQYGIQAQYDAAFSQCMYSRGNQVPGYGPVYAPTYAPTSYYDEASNLVRAVQAELNRLLYMKGLPDGVAGPQTVSAIRAYERANGLPVDGAASPYLLDRLRNTSS